MEEEHEALAAGTLVRGRYLVKGVLRAGSTGTVYLVKDQKAPEGWPAQLVLKEISGLEQRTRYNVVIAGTHLLQLRHVALPRIQALFNDEKRGCVCLVMEYIEGESLADVQWNRLDRTELRAWCEPLMVALTYLHRQEHPIFHGDLKPANLVRVASGKVMLLDLGYVPRPGGQGKAGCYRAPEQFSGILNERSDVYGCGALLYALLSGAEPVDALTRRTRVGRKKTDPLVLASKMSAAVPRELARVLQRALALDPAERFGSIREFWEALRPLLEEEPEEPEALLSPDHTLPRPGTSLDAAPTIPVSGWGKKSSSLPALSAPRVAVRRVPYTRGSHRWLLPGIAGAVALLLLLLSAGTWALGAVHLNGTASTRGITTPGKSLVTRTGTLAPGASPRSYPHLVGEFQGVLILVDSAPISAELVIVQQNQADFSGTFTSTMFTGTVSGVVDARSGLNWTVLDATHRTGLYFYGGLNGIDASHLNTPDNMGGSFYKCQPKPDLQCLPLEGSRTGGSWSLSFVPAG